MTELIILLLIFMVTPVLFYGMLCVFKNWIESQGEE
jgi:hypothetical protein